jgi:hypothetical protein
MLTDADRKEEMMTLLDDPRQQLHVDAADEAVLRMLTYADVC